MQATNRKTGFSLLECMIYCFILALISVCWFSAVSQIIGATRSSMTTVYTVQLLTSASDFLARDLREAPVSLREWHLSTQTHLSWPTAEGLVHWGYENGTLKRSMYLYHTKKWTTSIIAQRIGNACFKVTVDKGKMYRIDTFLESNGISEKRTVWMRKG